MGIKGIIFTYIYAGAIMRVCAQESLQWVEMMPMMPILPILWPDSFRLPACARGCA